MSFDYYYRDENEAGEVILQTLEFPTAKPLSLRVTEDDGQTTALINLAEEEIDRLIAGLQAAKRKLHIEEDQAEDPCRKGTCQHQECNGG